MTRSIGFSATAQSVKRANERKQYSVLSSSIVSVIESARSLGLVLFYEILPVILKTNIIALKFKRCAFHIQKLISNQIVIVDRLIVDRANESKIDARY